MNWPTHAAKSLVRGLGGLSPGCKEAIRLQSAALDRKLMPVERFGLAVHIRLCKWCRAYGRQIQFLNVAARNSASEDKPPRPETLSPQARERIQQALQSRQP
jgi:hypothetical protein